MGTAITSRPANASGGVKKACHRLQMFLAGVFIHGDHGAVRRRERHQVRLGHRPGPAEMHGLALEERALTPEIDIDEMPALPAIVLVGLLLGAEDDPPGPQRPHPVDGAIRTCPHKRESASGSQYPCHLGNGPLLVDPVPGRLGDDDVNR